MQTKYNNCKICKERSCASKVLNDEQLEELSKNVRTITINKGEIILFEGSFTSHVVYLKKGLVKETKKSTDGKEHIFRIFKSKTYLAMTSLFGDTVNHFSYIALTESEICNIEINTFKNLLLENSKFTYSIMSSLCKENLYSYDKLIKLSEKNIYGRLADALLFFSTNIFSSYKFKLPLSQQEIANFIGISRESCTRTLSNFKQSGIIKLNNSVLEILDINKLKDISRNG